MGGRILELPSDQIKKELKKERREGEKYGRREGRREGHKEGRVQTLLILVTDGFLTRQQAIDHSGLSAKEFERIEKSLQDD